MRRAAVDANQPEIVAALRAAGVTVHPLHAVGKGCPDLLCGFRGMNLCLEVKDGRKPPSDRRLTPEQAEWHAGWKGQVAVVTSAEEALAVVWAAVAIRPAEGFRSIGDIAAGMVERVAQR